MKEIGLTYINNFLNTEEENSIIQSIIKFKKDNPKLVANYGSNNYGSIYFGQRYKKDPILFPDFLVDLNNKLIQNNLVLENPFGIAINEYQRGQKIAAHIDKPISGPIVTIISLGSESTMVFKKDDSKIIQELEARSLVQLTKEIRNEWTHELLPVKNLRYSIIFRSQK